MFLKNKNGKNKDDKNKKKVKRVINKQKIFCFVSLIFILVCILWYGGRFVYFYLDSKKTIENKEQILATMIIDKNFDTDNFKKINSDYYFYGDAKTNYVTYSNMLFRIVKINKNNEITLVSDSPITSLAYGLDKSFSDNYAMSWLNESHQDNTGILEKNLNNKENYLVKTNTCVDKISDIKNISCKKNDDNYYLSMLSLVDYVNTGAEASFINNGYYTYFANDNGEEVWYVNDSGKLNTSAGDDIYGIKTVITIKSSVSLVSGDGTETSPYVIEDKTGYFGSYVKLGEDTWRVYEDGDVLKLVLDDYLKINGENLEHIYSYNNYYHNDTKYGSLAYYLNNSYLNSLSYKDLLVTNYYSNNYYGEDNGFDYSAVIGKTVDTKVAVLSIGNPIFNSTLGDYFTSTGTGENDGTIYTIKKDATALEVYSDDDAYIVPCISIKKESLKVGSGTSSDPYRSE